MILQDVLGPQLSPALTVEEMDKMDQARESSPDLPPLLKPDAGLFDGILTESWKGLPSGALKTGSSLLGAASSTVASPESIAQTALEAQEELGDLAPDFGDVHQFGARQSQGFDDTAREWRRTAKRKYAADPGTMGVVAQTIHGLLESLPEAVGYGMLAGPAGGSILFGADMGIRRAQELKDEGVDEATATNAGVVSFAANAIGMRLPASIGPTRMIGALSGAGINLAATGSEQGIVSYILNNANYSDLSEKYGFTLPSAGVSAFFGAAMGALFHTKPAAQRAVERQADRAARLVQVEDAIFSKLVQSEAYTGNEVTARAEAKQKALSAVNLAEAAQVDPMDIVPKIEIVDGEARMPEDAFKMPETQGVHWEMGSHVIGKENEQIQIVHLKQETNERKAALESLKQKLDRGLKNRDSGWELHGSASDAKKSLPPFKFSGYGKNPPPSGLYNAIVANLEELAKEAKLVESLRDHQHNNQNVKGVHKFVVPATYLGKDFRVQLIVRDYTKAAGGTLSVHSIDHIEIHAVERVADGVGDSATLAPMPTANALPKPSDSVGAPVSSQWSSASRTTLSDLLQGFQRDDGKGAFDQISDTDRQEGAVYYDAEKTQKRFKQEVRRGVDSELVERAVETFGVTNNPEEAGYILPDGRMLDFSGRHWGLSDAEARGQRQVDHVDVGEVEGVDSSDRSGGIYDFMARSGAMRFDLASGIASIAGTPTARQLSVLGRSFKGKYLALSRNTPEGRIVADTEFESASLRKIEDFFNEAQRKVDRGEIDGAFAQKQEAGVAGFYDPTTGRIGLTKNANLSTFTHEWGHWYLTQLFNFVRDGRMTAEMQEDVQTLLSSFGIKSLKDWDALGFEGQVRFQEQFARQFEQYLSTGKAPSTGLRFIFETIANAIREAYSSTESTIAREYKAQTGFDLPPMSKEVRGVFDRMFREQGSLVNEDHVAAARVMQAQEKAQEKAAGLSEQGKPSAEESRASDARSQAVNDAEDAINAGETVDVSASMADMRISDPVVIAKKKALAKEHFSKPVEKDPSIILQPRARDRKASVDQMTGIAMDPQYGRVSFSRETSAGAPIVSYGKLPDDAHLGHVDYVMDGDRRVAVVYAVVEAGELQASNSMHGAVNPNYGKTTDSQITVIAGNGRVAGLQGAYSRGSAGKYRRDLQADAMHGVDPKVIEGMKQPVLVRYVAPQDVTSGFIARSNHDQVLHRSATEIAQEDAPKLRKNIVAGRYEFNDDGIPTNSTVAQFIADTGEKNAMGTLVNSSGEPTPEAVRRIRQAVFYEAYRNDRLAELFAETRDSGIVRILNGLVAVAPKVIQLREATGGATDIGRYVSEAVNAIYVARKNGVSMADVAGQMDAFNSSVTHVLQRLLADYADSAKQLREILGNALDWGRNALDAQEGSLLGDEFTMQTSIADLFGEVRRQTNLAREARGEARLPDLDIEAMRPQLEAEAAEARAATEAARAEEAARLERMSRQADEMDQATEKLQQDLEEAGRTIDAMGDEMLRQGEPVDPSMPTEAEIDAAVERTSADEMNARRESASEALSSQEAAEAREVSRALEEFPDMTIVDENGNEVSAADLLAELDSAEKNADTEAAGMLEATQCIMRNGGWNEV